MMLVKDEFIPATFKDNPVFPAGSSRSFHKVLERFYRILTILHDPKFLFVVLKDNAGCFLAESKNTACQHRDNNSCLSHFVVLLLGFVLLFNVDIYSACSAADCNLYESSYYQGCSPTTGNNQYQCGGGSGSCSDVCGGCGYRIRTAGYLNRYQKELDDYCAQYHPCPHGDAKCTGLRPLRTIAIGLCGIGYESDFDIEAICGCVNRSSSSSAPSSSSSAPSSSSSFLECRDKNASQICYYNVGGYTSCNATTMDDWCAKRGYFCGVNFDIGDNAECYAGYRLICTNGSCSERTYVGCEPCISSSVESSSSSATSSNSESSSDSGGGESESGQSSSGGGGSGGDGGVIPCGWGDYPPCIVEPIEPEFCVKNPDICYEIGGIDDTLSRYGSAIVDSLGRLIGRLDSLDLGGPGSCLDSANCRPADWGGDSIPYAPGDSAAGSGGSGSGSGGAYSWLRAILSAASIPAASRSCPALPKVEFELGGESHSLDLDICKSEFNLAGHHPLELFGLILRAVSAIAAVVIVLGSVTSLNAGFSKMRRLGG